jgi:tetratricopeptide (TPR) repeat protein
MMSAKPGHLSREINLLFEQGEWVPARALLEKELHKPGNENDHWLLTRIGTTFYEERDYQTALKYAQKAYERSPSCPLVLWDYAGTLDALGDSREAFRIYWTLLDKEPAGVSAHDCGKGEGRRWTVGLLTDCIYRAALCLKHLGMKDEAIQLFREYLRVQGPKSESIYTREDADAQLEELGGDQEEALLKTLESESEKIGGVAYRALLMPAG